MKFGQYLYGEKWIQHRKMKGGTYTEIVGEIEKKDAQQLTPTVVDKIKQLLKSRGYFPAYIKVEVGRL